jgi:hypothetical protein
LQIRQWRLDPTIRDHGRLEVADLETIEAIAVEGFRVGLAASSARAEAGLSNGVAVASNSQPGAGAKYTAAG